MHYVRRVTGIALFDGSTVLTRVASLAHRWSVSRHRPCSIGRRASQGPRILRIHVPIVICHSPVRVVAVPSSLRTIYLIWGAT